MYKLLIAVALLIQAAPLQGQKVLQIEKRNSAQSIKFQTSDIISIKLIGEKKWFSGVIYDLNLEKEFIEFENRIVFLKEIAFIRRGKSGYGNNLMRGFSTSLMGFGASWAIFSLGDAAVTERSFTEVDAAISAGSIGLGYLLTKFFSLRKYRIGNKWNFRMLNLDVIPAL